MSLHTYIRPHIDHNLTDTVEFELYCPTYTGIWRNKLAIRSSNNQQIQSFVFGPHYIENSYKPTYISNLNHLSCLDLK